MIILDFRRYRKRKADNNKTFSTSNDLKIQPYIDAIVLKSIPPTTSSTSLQMWSSSIKSAKNI